MIRKLQSYVLRAVPPIFGRAAQGDVSMDLEEMAQVFSVRDAMLRGSFERRNFQIRNNHVGAGALSASADFWLVSGWEAIVGSGGTSPGPLPGDHDAMVVGIGMRSTNGATLVTVAYISVVLPAVPGSGVSPAIQLASARVGPSATITEMDNLSTHVPYTFQRVSGNPTISWNSIVTAATDMYCFIDVISAPQGILPIA